MNDLTDLINKLLSTQNELMAAATNQHVALEKQRMRIG
jgi:hypothetical protein